MSARSSGKPVLISACFFSLENPLICFCLAIITMVSTDTILFYVISLLNSGDSSPDTRATHRTFFGVQGGRLLAGHRSDTLNFPGVISGRFLAGHQSNTPNFLWCSRREIPPFPCAPKRGLSFRIPLRRDEESPAFNVGILRRG
jgi:hypothetical protein